MANSPIACATCGAQIDNPKPLQKYCDRRCKDRRSRSRPERISSITYQCWWCGVDYHPKRIEQNKCCSRECGFKWKGFALRARSGSLTVKHRVHKFKCLVCQGPHSSHISTQRICSDDCRKEYARQQAKISYECLRNVEPRNCAECGVSFTPAYGTKRRKFCSDKCARRNHKRTARKRERALLRQAQVEPVNPIKVFERDGWRCCHCGTRTPRRLRGTYDDRAPEMDHIEPLSQGGEHSYRNTQCLCRRCNAAKSDGAGGQLRLFG